MTMTVSPSPRDRRSRLSPQQQRQSGNFFSFILSVIHRSTESRMKVQMLQVQILSQLGFDLLKLKLEGIWDEYFAYRPAGYSIFPKDTLWIMSEGVKTPGIITGGVRGAWPPLGPLPRTFVSSPGPQYSGAPEEIGLTSHQERGEDTARLMASCRGYWEACIL